MEVGLWLGGSGFGLVSGLEAEGLLFWFEASGVEVGVESTVVVATGEAAPKIE